jgi:transcription elongation factor GreA
LSEDIKQRLQSELDGLESELRVHLPKEIKRALEFGDLRENSEFRAALDRQNMVKARIVELRQRISEIASIDIKRVPRDKASYGSTLILYDGERDEEVTYRLVTPEESDPQKGFISTTSPVGKSLMGKQKGDEVVVRTPAGARNFQIRKLTTIHEQIENKVPNTGSSENQAEQRK